MSSCIGLYCTTAQVSVNVTKECVAILMTPDNAFRYQEDQKQFEPWSWELPFISLYETNVLLFLAKHSIRAPQQG